MFAFLFESVLIWIRTRWIKRYQPDVIFHGFGTSAVLLCYNTVRTRCWEPKKCWCSKLAARNWRLSAFKWKNPWKCYSTRHGFWSVPSHLFMLQLSNFYLTCQSVVSQLGEEYMETDFKWFENIMKLFERSWWYPINSPYIYPQQNTEVERCQIRRAEPRDSIATAAWKATRHPWDVPSAWISEKSHQATLQKYEARGSRAGIFHVPRVLWE